MRLRNRTAIVTGAASGIGRAIAIAFAREGAKVTVADMLDLPKEGGDPTADVIRRAGGAALTVRTDIGKESDIARMVANTVTEWGRLDVMVNCAATWNSQPLMGESAESWDRVMAVNVRGYMLCCQHAIRQMLTQAPLGDARGRIVNINSQHGIVCAPNDLAYGTSKAAGIYMTKQIAVDYAKDRIICNGINPGRIVTGKGGVSQSLDGIAAARLATPMPRFGRPSDIASAAVFLASEEAGYMTGTHINVDGGWLAS
ncbi:MAG: SDR family oxidoreductase [Alphaproteobacteria bacterium]